MASNGASGFGLVQCQIVTAPKLVSLERERRVLEQSPPRALTPLVASGPEWKAELDPLYMLTRSLQWKQERDTSAGWELLEHLRSGDREVRGLATLLLSKSERLRARELRRARRRINRLHIHDVAGATTNPAKANAMNTPYGLEMVESCLTCRLRKNHWFCGLSPEGLKLLGEASHLITYPAGALLFVEGQSPRGTFCALLGQSKAFHHLARRQSAHTPDRRSRGSPGF